MIELQEFQTLAATTMADRFVQYMDNPAQSGTLKNPRIVPFYQALSSITASGKTVILADVVSAIRLALPVAPIVLWMSKGKVVVEQSLANLMPGGKYHHLLGDAEVRPLAEYDPDEVAEVKKPIVFFATVGTFNQKDKEEGSLVIYQSDLDNTPQSTWDRLKIRTRTDSYRRPLIVVYDEAQNLTDQQVGLLMELEPDAFLLASATMQIPAQMNREVIEPLKAIGWTDDTLVTQVDAAAVAESGLVKTTVVMAGYQSPMEETIAVLMKDMRQAVSDAEGYHLDGKPKAIYVCNTNIVEGNANQHDDPKQPFNSRQAPPIRIWRELVNKHKVDPDDIAVYCALKMHRDYPAPEGFRLFKGGDKDYESFTDGDYHHVIFNLSLQEGWDDPWCYFAYIDKSMESAGKIEQVIGRVLRQPGGQHYPAERLNMARFYVRVDRNQTFQKLVTDAEKKLNNEAPGLRFISTAPDKAAPIEYAPKEDLTVPGTALEAKDAVEPVAELIKDLSDYRDDARNTRGKGSRTIVQRRVGDTSDAEVKWETFEQSGRVLARWIFQREIRKLYPVALGVAPTSDGKFDALVGLGSPAEKHITKVAHEVVDAYLDNVDLTQKRLDPFIVGSQIARPDDFHKFKKALHAGYDRLNPLEVEFAKALDKHGKTWARNPSRTGYGIPLPSLGPTHNFYPDFIVWVDAKNVILIDTKGGHLLSEAAARKLLYINPPRNSPKRIYVRLVSEGKYNTDVQLLKKDGFTVWGSKAGHPRTVKHYDTLDLLIPHVLKPGR